ncbi:hypothetical protein [Peribacillus simplex]|uniref:Uncharacterized protein n=2 Tax=Peribacillus simplex TaxID=1478 RepID=A0A9W4L7L0_9BACI|nr:hypothetical protein [Peribacillus simplex]MDR4929566.1 hypothetical protein [Peribacillus simplex]WHX90699.1 hypothetical protein QNH50_22365 [Peribacillus simplex]CAH0276166.1 hypothetical protein SRABI133_03807 [Peribacillus simplex]
MFKISTFLEKTNEGEESYASLDDSLKLREIFDHRKFTPEHIQMRITIKYNNQVVVGFDVPSGLDLWSDYMVAIEQYLDGENVERLYGIDPYLIKLVSINNNLLEFSIVGDWEPVEVFAQAVLPEKEFLESILDGAEHFWETLIDYKVFEEKEIGKTTFGEEPKLMIEEIEKLRKKVKTLFN